MCCTRRVPSADRRRSKKKVSGPGKFSQGLRSCPSGLRHDSRNWHANLFEATSAALTDPFLELVVTARSC